MISIKINESELSMKFPGIADGIKKDERIKAMCSIIDDADASVIRTMIDEARITYNENVIFLIYRFLVVIKPLRESGDKDQKDIFSGLKEFDDLERFIHDSPSLFDEIVLKKDNKSFQIRNKHLLSFFGELIRSTDTPSQYRKKLRDHILETKKTGVFQAMTSEKGGKPLKYSDLVRNTIIYELFNNICAENLSETIKKNSIELFIGKLFAKSGWFEKDIPSKSKYETDDAYLIKNVHNIIVRNRKLFNKG
ncbi:MAG TPA: hypothetical protein PLW31_03890 [Bacteroidales bacterium]|nr:hypothetical protein [Bacteroidales bacterium]